MDGESFAGVVRLDKGASITGILPGRVVVPGQRYGRGRATGSRLSPIFGWEIHPSRESCIAGEIAVFRAWRSSLMASMWGRCRWCGQRFLRLDSVVMLAAALSLVSSSRWSRVSWRIDSA
jgi:hypothetical protein